MSKCHVNDLVVIANQSGPLLHASSPSSPMIYFDRRFVRWWPTRR